MKLSLTSYSMLASILLFDFSGLSWGQEIASQPAPKAILVTLEKQTSKYPRYSVDGKEAGDPLRGIARAFEKHGGVIDYPVIVLVDGRLPIEEFYNARMFIGKVGLVKARYFIWNASKTRIAEFSFEHFYEYPEGLGSALDHRKWSRTDEPQSR